ncbi:MAG: hypothetical protein JWM93_472 [Frankiales bacterium]|nr:hypothetical protein [Frankiales bacterium]
MTESWRTDDDLTAAAERFAAAIDGWVAPAAHGTVLVTPDGTASLLVATAGAGLLPAAVLAGVVGYSSGTRTIDVSLEQLRQAIAALAPAEAATHLPHPNIAAWRTLHSALEYDPACRAIVIFVQDLGEEPSSPYDALLRSELPTPVPRAPASDAGAAVLDGDPPPGW